MSQDEDPVARNRSVHPRRTPDRTPLGDQTLRNVMAITAVLISVATLVLVAILLR